jgi:orotidine 5'-phosphate decarboxylase subfamily 2
VSDAGFHYASGGIGPYYIDLRRGCNDSTVFKLILKKYGEQLNFPKDNKLLFVGVPTTGVVYATGLALTYNQPVAVIEKLNPAKVHVFSDITIRRNIYNCASKIMHPDKCAFLGLEDMGVMLATAMGMHLDRPSAILRRIEKGHGTSQTIEGNLDKFSESGVNTLVVMNDPYNPLSDDELETTIKSVPGANRFELLIMTLPKLLEVDKALMKKRKVYEIEDLWTTGTSAITLYHNIKKALNVTPDVLVFLDREQHAMTKFNKLGITANSVFKITEIADYLLKQSLIEEKVYKKVTDYVNQFQRQTYTEKLAALNDTCTCVGIDITPGKFPKTEEDTILPNYPYSPDADGVRRYVLDVLDEITKVKGVNVIKPNLAYYNNLKDPKLHAILYELLERARALNILVILDTKIGDIMRTQSQYAEKYKEFDAVTIHGFMGRDSVYPVTDTMLGAYALVFTSNPSREDIETQPILTHKSLEDYTMMLEGGKTQQEAYELTVKSSKKVYNLMAEKIVEWQFSGSVGAVIGGTVNEDGELAELEEIVEYFARALDYLPPILIPGVGTQGGDARDVIKSLITAMRKAGWDATKRRTELRKVVINSASAINYAPSPKKATQDLVDKISSAIEEFNSDE